MSRMRRAVFLGLLTGIVGLTVSMVPAVAALEDRIGLRWLFLARGTSAPPRDVAIVSIDEAAAARMELPPLPRDWPRSVHARLVDRLVQHGASAVVFDVQFFRHSPSPRDDDAFARAIAESGRVALVQRLEVAHVGGREIWEQQNPIPPLASAAAALAPAPVPDAPFVSSFWTFLRTPHAGEVPSLPAVALQLHSMPVVEQFVRGLEEAGVTGLESLPPHGFARQRPAELLRMMQTIRRAASANQPAVSRMLAQLAAAEGESPAPDIQRIRALANLYGGAGSGYLNFYGPPGTICTVPYDVILADAAEANTSCALRGAVVFVGLGKGRVTRAGQLDSYYTIYGGEDDAAFSGVELHATAFSNVLTGATLRQAGPGAAFAIFVLVGMFLGGIGYCVRTWRRRSKGAMTARVRAAAVLSGLAVTYGLLAYLCFTELQLVIPLVVPLAVQFPTALIAGLLTPPIRDREQVRAVCLVTDAAGSTALGQELPHRQYARLMSDYNEAISRPAWAHGGEVLAPQGDGFVCVWTIREGSDNAGSIDRSTRAKACQAALGIASAAEEFNRAQPDHLRLPTRIGLTVGAVMICSDADRGVFEVFGDPVNIAARLRDLNVQLGTSLLASQEVLNDLDTVVSIRPLPGTFAMKGVAHPPPVFEVSGLASSGPPRPALDV